MLSDIFEKKFSELGSPICQIALYKGLISMRDEIDQEVGTNFKNEIVGVLALSSLKTEVEQAIIAIEKILDRKILDKLKGSCN